MRYNTYMEYNTQQYKQGVQYTMRYNTQQYEYNLMTHSFDLCGKLPKIMMNWFKI